MRFIFRGLARVDGFSDLRASSKDSVETVEVLEELPSTSPDISPSSRLAAPLSSVGSVPILSKAAILSYKFIPRKPTIILEIFFILSATYYSDIIPGIISSSLEPIVLKIVKVMLYSRNVPFMLMKLSNYAQKYA